MRFHEALDDLVIARPSPASTAVLPLGALTPLAALPRAPPASVHTAHRPQAGKFMHLQPAPISEIRCCEVVKYLKRHEMYVSLGKGLMQNHFEIERGSAFFS